MSATRFTRSELATKYPEKEWRNKFLDILSLVEILRGCIIESSYRPSEALNEVILLSGAGKKVRDQLTTQEKVNAKDARVLALLGLVHIEPLVDVENFDVEKLAEAISAEVVSGALRYPLVFGRDLYDRAAELFKEERDYLNHEDTLRLLDGTPQGVFQSGFYLVGPYGIFKCAFERVMPPRTAIPLQHCSDAGCLVVHRVSLTTSIEAGVNRSRPLLNKVLDATSEEPSEWNGFISDLLEDEHNGFDLENTASIHNLVGDCFSDDELKALALHAESNTKGKLQDIAKAFDLAGSPESYIATMSRSQVLQLLFMLDDKSLVALVDSAVRENKIVVPGNEVRRPRVNGRSHVGAWRLRSELSRLGVRAVGLDPALPLLRLSALAREQFDKSSNNEMEELAWMLRSTEGSTPVEQLEEFLRTTGPENVVETLLLSRKTNATRICTELGIPLEQPNSSLRDAILWKLGFPLPRSADIRDEYWEWHNRLESLAKTATVNVDSTADSLRSVSSEYFVRLEHFLFDSLAFATWALLHDHYDNDSPFVYFERSSKSFAIDALNSPIDGGVQGELTLEPVLSAVVDGFSRLSKHLSTLRGADERYVRPGDNHPKYSAKTSLQKFPFQHIYPFLDLTPESQVRLADSLQMVASELNESGIMTARNGLLHSKQEVPTVEQVESSLRRARQALDQLESIGCVRNTFAIASTLTNAWGRSTTTLISNGRTISFSSPSAYQWAKLPNMQRPHYLMQGAVFAAPNEMLRFSEGFASEFQAYWSAFPHRPEPGNRVVSSQSETVATSLDTGSFAASRAG